MSQITSTPEKIEFLRVNMLRPFCLKWPSFGKNIDRFGEETVLNDYANVFGGRGYTSAHIKKGLEAALNLSMCPDPKALYELVISVNKTDKDKPKDPFKFTMEEKLTHRAMMKVVLSKSRNIRAAIKKTAPDLKSSSSAKQNARQTVTSYIDNLTATLKEGRI